MTEQEVEILAEAIVKKLIAKQEEYDKAFQNDIKDMAAGGGNIEVGVISQIDLIKDQITKLGNDQATAAALEDYNTASLIKARIEDLKTKYKL
tara:strand:+ start:100 stop:378 length:279 start_codon:yes stop_codon:yes gene_type:complete